MDNVRLVLGGDVYSIRSFGSLTKGSDGEDEDITQLFVSEEAFSIFLD